jgi:hypothetical protein
MRAERLRLGEVDFAVLRLDRVKFSFLIASGVSISKATINDSEFNEIDLTSNHSTLQCKKTIFDEVRTSSSRLVVSGIDNVLRGWKSENDDLTFAGSMRIEGPQFHKSRIIFGRGTFDLTSPSFDASYVAQARDYPRGVVRMRLTDARFSQCELWGISFHISLLAASLSRSGPSIPLTDPDGLPAGSIRTISVEWLQNCKGLGFVRGGGLSPELGKYERLALDKVEAGKALNDTEQKLWIQLAHNAMRFSSDVLLVDWNMFESLKLFRDVVARSLRSLNIQMPEPVHREFFAGQ